MVSRMEVMLAAVANRKENVADCKVTVASTISTKATSFTTNSRSSVANTSTNEKSQATPVIVKPQVTIEESQEADAVSKHTVLYGIAPLLIWLLIME